MKKFLSSILDGGTPKQRKQKTFALMAIAITAALIVIALVTLCALAIADAAKAPTEEEEGAGTGVSRDLVTTTDDNGQLYRGNLIVVNDTYLYSAEANASVTMKKLGSNRCKAADGSEIYYMNDTENFQATEDALNALNRMIADFHAETQDTNIYIMSAASALGNSDNLYASGMAFEFGYYYSVKGQNGAEATVIKTISEDAKYNWIFQNAYKYGFVQLFDDANATTTEDGQTVSQKHILRYVGVEHAALAKDANCTTLDAYLAYLRENTSLNKTKSVKVSVTGEDGKTQQVTYKIFYQAQTAEGTYYTADPNKFVATVSGDNASGYIVSYCAKK